MRPHFFLGRPPPTTRPHCSDDRAQTISLADVSRFCWAEVLLREPALAAPRKGEPAPSRKPMSYQLPARTKSNTGYSAQPPKMCTSSTIHAVSPFQNP
jgi:hypothetical protein